MPFSVLFAFLTLFFASSLWISEEALNGRGLQLVALWLTISLVQGLRILNGRQTAVPRLHLADGGILLIVLGHLVSTAFVFANEGDRRSAVNLSAEWTGLLAVWFLVRCLSIDKASRRIILQAVFCVTVGMACFGVWQHHVLYPQDARWYQELRKELDESLKEPAGRGFARASEIVREFQQQGVPLDGPERVLWENRLLHSSEPLGPFALANTLAGLLSAGLVILASVIARMLQKEARFTRGRMMGSAIVGALLLYCLLLTKSRSAWAGLMVGWALVALRSLKGASGRRLIVWCSGAAIGCGLLATIVALSGGLDREVILESPRSLQFRLFYWNASLQMLKQSPMFGVGPGNFRQHYLMHKYVESSEEIRDPHNFILDAWASSGLLGLAGVVVLCVTCIRILAGTESDRANGTNADSSKERFSILWILAGFAFHVAREWSGGADMPSFAYLSLVPFGAIVSSLIMNRLPLDGSSGLPAMMALGVHLLAAGGFEMTFVMMTALVLIGVSITGEHIANSGQTGLKTAGVIACVGSLATVVIVIQWALLPVANCDRNLSLADSQARIAADLTAIRPQYRLAQESDPWAVLPRQRQAEQEAYRLREFARSRQMSEGQVSDEAVRKRWTDELKEAVTCCDRLISVDRQNVAGYLLRAECLATAGNALKDPQLLEQALVDQKIAVQMNPTAVSVWYRLAQLYQLTGQPDEASHAAKRALEIEQINQEWGHTDQFLPTEQRQELELIRGSRE